MGNLPWCQKLHWNSLIFKVIIVMKLEKFDFLDLMEIKGGVTDGDIKCSPNTSAVSCNAPNSGVRQAGGHGVG